MLCQLVKKLGVSVSLQVISGNTKKIFLFRLDQNQHIVNAVGVRLLVVGSVWRLIMTTPPEHFVDGYVTTAIQVLES